MSCDRRPPEQSSLWTPTPDFTKNTAILPGENIECFARRANDQIKDPPSAQPPNKIDNTSITSDLSLNVDETFKLTVGSTQTAALWEISTDGVLGAAPSGLTFSAVAGTLKGQVDQESANKNYKILIKARDGGGEEIDSREFNFFPKVGGKDDTIKFVWPLSPKGVLTSKFGPRRPPVNGASSNHGGIDIANPRNAPGTILAAADGTVVRCGPGRGWGTVIMIEHRDAQNRLVCTTAYGHWSEAYVTVGQKVSAGQRIAKEGNEGRGSGPHLHFEIHRGTFKNPLDPLPFLTVDGAQVSNGNSQADGSPTGGTTTVTNRNRGMTTAEATGGGPECPSELPNQFGGGQGATGPTPEPIVAETPEKQEVLETISEVLDERVDLIEEDRDLIKFLAQAESNFEPELENPVSDAKGVFQMSDKEIEKYYAMLDDPIEDPTDEQKKDPVLATKAAIIKYKDEYEPVWDDFVSSGKGSINGKPLDDDVKTRYENLTKAEFIYGLVHHDGVKNAAAGEDKQGIDYYRKKVTGQWDSGSDFGEGE